MAQEMLLPLATRSLLSEAIATTFGAFYICTALAFMLSGLILHQTYRYFHLYPEDSMYLKVMVGGLLMIDTLHSASALHVCYYYLSESYFSPQNLVDGVWSIQSLVMQTGILVFISQCFFGRRLFILADRKLVYLIVIVTLLLGELAMCIVATVKIVQDKSFAAFQNSMWTLWVTFAMAVTIDVICSIGLTYHLQKNRTGFRRTDSMVDILMLYTLNTGICTSLCTLGALVCAVILPGDLIYSGVYVIASKLYVNSLLAVLNSRHSILQYGMACWDTASLGLQITTPMPEESLRFAIPPDPYSSAVYSKELVESTRGGIENMFSSR